jgi:hypothetical protein
MISETKGEKQRIKWTMTNVQRGAQPDSLFELPPGSRPMMAGMGDLSSMMEKMGAAGATAPGMPAAAKPTPGTAAASDDKPSSQDPNIVEEIGAEAAETAKQTTKDETNNAVRKGISEGIRGLFGR